MYNLKEYDSFVRKFANLWKSGICARLSVETEKGHACVSLHVGLGQACPPQVHQPADGYHRGGGPARQRRREKRAAARQETAMAEEVKEKCATENDAKQSEAIDNQEQEMACSNTSIVTENNVTETQKCSTAKEFDV